MNTLFFPPLLIIFIGLIFIAFASLAESFEYYERFVAHDPIKQKDFSKYWHWFQLFERAFAILFGFSLAYSDAPIKIIFFIASLFWIIYDGAINYARNQNIFYLSGQSSSYFDLLGNKYLKLFFLFLSLFLLSLEH